MKPMPDLYAKRYTLNAKRGFTLIEILISLFFVGTLVTLLFSASSSLLTKRRGDLQDTAAKVASREIENLRNQSFSSITSSPLKACPSTQDSYKLPNCQISRTVTQNYDGNSNVKQINVNVSWTEAGQSKSLTMDTLIYSGGI